MEIVNNIRTRNRKKTIIIISFLIAVLIMSVICLFIGSSNMSVRECIDALHKMGKESNIRIIWNIRIPRVLAAIFGANLSIIAFAGGFLSTGNNLSNYGIGANPYATSLMAFVFSTASILVILLLCRFRSFAPNVVVLVGIAIGSIWTAATTILQFYATDVGLSAAVIWNFGDLGRATYRTDGIVKYSGGRECFTEEIIKDIFGIKVKIVELNKEKIFMGWYENEK